MGTSPAAVASRQTEHASGPFPEENPQRHGNRIALRCTTAGRRSARSPQLIERFHSSGLSPAQCPTTATALRRCRTKQRGFMGQRARLSRSLHPSVCPDVGHHLSPHCLTQGQTRTKTGGPVWPSRCAFSVVSSSCAQSSLPPAMTGCRSTR
jgi:hypothetical protein